MPTTEDDVLDALRHAPDPVVTAQELADELPIGRRTVLNKLKILEAADRVRSKKVGGRARVWWCSELDDALDELRSEE